MAKRKEIPPGPDAAPQPPKEDEGRRIVATFTDGPAFWCIQADGHYRPLRYGNIEPETRVRPKWGDTRKRGVVQALIQGYGVPRPVIAVVNWGPPATQRGWAPAPGSRIDGPAEVIRYWPAEELEPAP